MMVLLAVLLWDATVVAQPTQEPAQAPKPYQVEKIAVGTGVESRELVGEAAEFDVSAGRIFCWMRISAQDVPTTIKHVWYADGQQAAEVPLNISYPSMRTWSSKAIWAGKWKVEVVSEKGDVLASTDFTVKGQAQPSVP
jgi:hypothetical protein